MLSNGEGDLLGSGLSLTMNEIVNFKRKQVLCFCGVNIGIAHGQVLFLGAKSGVLSNDGIHEPEKLFCEATQAICQRSKCIGGGVADMQG